MNPLTEYVCQECGIVVEGSTRKYCNECLRNFHVADICRDICNEPLFPDEEN